MYTRGKMKEMLRGFFNRKNQSLSITLNSDNYGMFVSELRRIAVSMQDDFFFIGRMPERDRRFTALVDLRDTYNNACLIVDDNYDFISKQQHAALVFKIHNQLTCKVLEMDEQIIAFISNSQTLMIGGEHESL